MAYIVMAYLVMAYLGMAHLFMAYTVMAYIAMACTDMARIVTAYRVMAYTVMAGGTVESEVDGHGGAMDAGEGRPRKGTAAEAATDRTHPEGRAGRAAALAKLVNSSKMNYWNFREFAGGQFEMEGGTAQRRGEGGRAYGAPAEVGDVG